MDERKLAGCTLLRTLGEGHRPIKSMAWSPDGKYLAATLRDKTICVWNVVSGKRYREIDIHQKSIQALAWSPDGVYIASGSTDRTIHLWNTENNRELSEIIKCKRNVLCLTWFMSQDRLMFACGSDEHDIRLWMAPNAQLGSGLEEMNPLRGHSRPVNAIAWSSNKKSSIASASDDGTVRLWDVGIENCEWKWTYSHARKCRFPGVNWNYALSLAWSPDGKLIAAGFIDGSVRILDVNNDGQLIKDKLTGKEIGLLNGHSSSVRALSFSNDGRLLASKSGGRAPRLTSSGVAWNGSVRLWRTDCFQQVGAINEPADHKWCTGLCFHPKDNLLATLGHNNSTIRIWELHYRDLLGG